MLSFTKLLWFNLHFCNYCPSTGPKVKWKGKFVRLNPRIVHIGKMMEVVALDKRSAKSKWEISLQVVQIMQKYYRSKLGGGGGVETIFIASKFHNESHRNSK